MALGLGLPVATLGERFSYSLGGESLPGIPPAPRPNYGLVGCVVAGEQGNVYLRFTGPDVLIRSQLKNFRKFIDSAKSAVSASAVIRTATSRPAGLGKRPTTPGLSKVICHSLWP